MSDRIWTLAPADLGTLWEECARCFYLGAGGEFPRPVGGADASLELLVSALEGRRTERVAAGMPGGVLEVGHRSVQSQPLSIQVPDSSYRCVIRGALDLTVALDDATLGVVEAHGRARAPAPRMGTRARKRGSRQGHRARCAALQAGAERPRRCPGERDGVVGVAAVRAGRFHVLWLPRGSAVAARTPGAARWPTALPLVRLPRREPPHRLLGSVVLRVEEIAQPIARQIE